MKSSSPQNALNRFLIFLIVSLVGNACADFGIIWHAVGQVSLSSKNVASSRTLSTYYIGQSVGVMLLAPILAIWMDRYSRRITSIVLDGLYSFILFAMIGLDSFSNLGVESVFIFAVTTSALGTLHRNAIGIGVLKVLSKQMGVTHLVAKFSAAFFLTNLVGSCVSGIAYEWLGLSGCLFLAVLTFIPMPWIYLRLFLKEDGTPASLVSRGGFWTEVSMGLRFIFKDKILFSNSLCVTLWNFSSNMFPGLVGIAFQKSFPGKTSYASFAVSAAIFAGFLSFTPLERLAKRLSIRSILPVSLLLPITTMAFCALTPNPWIFLAALAFNCCGAAMVNILSGSVRVSRVPDSYTARVNTAHAAFMNIGQVAGGLCLIPLLEKSLSSGALLIALSFTLSSVFSIFLMPSIYLHEIVEAQI